MPAELAEPPPKPSRRGFAPRFDTVTKLQVRSMYVLQELGPTEIARKTGLGVMQIQKLANREGWTAARAEAKRKMIQAIDAHDSAEIASVVKTIAIKSEELGVATLFKAGDVLENESGEFWAKDVQSLSQAAKNFVGLARQARGLDSAASDNGGKTNVVFIALQRIGVEPTNEQIADAIDITIDTPSVPQLTLEADDGGF